MAKEGQRFYQKLMDGKIHECEYVKPYEGTNLWIAAVVDNHNGYKQGETFLCDPSYRN